MTEPNLIEDLRATLAGDVLEAALALLGAELVHGDLRVKLVEVEAYRGYGDPGCHTYRGMTPRTRIMFGPAGHAYTYFTYGNHWMLNVVAGPEGEGSAVLLRAAMPIAGHESMRSRRPKATKETELLSGPGKLAAALGIDRNQYGLDMLSPRSQLRIVAQNPPTRILVGPRIGLTHGMGDGHLWRFVDAENVAWASRPVRSLQPFEGLETIRI